MKNQTDDCPKCWTCVTHANTNSLNDVNIIIFLVLSLGPTGDQDAKVEAPGLPQITIAVPEIIKNLKVLRH